MLKIDMAASIRKVTGKGAMRQLRMQGMTPAVVYGGGEEALPLQLETTAFFKQLLEIYRKNAIITLTLDDGSVKDVLVKDVQTDPVKDALIHADFIEIDTKKPRQFEVPVTFVGNPRGCDLGGLLNVASDFVTVEGKPLDIPDEVVIDIAHLEIGDKIVVDDLDIPSNVTRVSGRDEVLVSIVTPSLADDVVDEDEEDVEAGAETDAEEPAAETGSEGETEG